MRMTPAQAGILVTIARLGAVTTSDLAREARYDTGATSRLMHRFVGLGWVERCLDGHRRRGCHLKLTPLGHDAAARARDLLAAHWTAMLAEWNREDCVTLIALLWKLEATLAPSGVKGSCCPPAEALPPGSQR